MDDDGFAEGGGDDVVMSAEWGEDVLIGELADGIEPVFLTDQGDSSADDDPAGCEESDYLGQCECEGGAGCCQDGGRIVVACRGGFGDECGGDELGVEAGAGEDGPIGLLEFDFSLCERPGGGGDCPAGGDQLELAPGDARPSPKA